MHKIAVAVLLALIAAPALAEDHVPGPGEEPKEKSATQKADDVRAERAYQRSLNNVPDQKPVDPWGSARGDDASKRSAAPARPVVKQSSKAKSGSTANKSGSTASKSGSTASKSGSTASKSGSTASKSGSTAN